MNVFSETFNIVRQSKTALRDFFEDKQLKKHFFSCFESSMDIFKDEFHNS